MVDLDKALFWARSIIGEYPLSMDAESLKVLVAAIEELQKTIDDAKNHSSYASWACPLCTYNNGIFIKSCGPHAELMSEIETNRELCYENTLLKANIAKLNGANTETLGFLKKLRNNQPDNPVDDVTDEVAASFADAFTKLE